MIIIKGKYTIISHTRFIHLAYLYLITVSLKQMTSTILHNILLMGLSRGKEGKRVTTKRKKKREKVKEKKKGQQQGMRTLYSTEKIAVADCQVTNHLLADVLSSGG